MEDAFCTDCKKTTLAVLDHVTGDLICTECALVLESYLIDDTPEWRIFNDDSKDSDPIRVGQPTTTTTSVLLGVCDLSTVITLPNGKKSDFLPGSFACRKLNQGPNPDNSVIAGLNTIADMVDRLGLIPTIKDRACEIYTKLQDQKRNRGRNHDAILVACLYVACKQENKPRTVKELCAVANGTTMKEFLRAKNYIVKQLQADMGHSNIGVVHAGDFLRRFCSHLGMNFQSVKAAQETVQKIEESDKIDIRRNPLSIAAAVIYMITRLSKERKPAQLREVSVATGVAEGTIRNAYKDLYLHVSTIIPCWFAKKEDLRNL